MLTGEVAAGALMVQAGDFRWQEQLRLTQLKDMSARFTCTIHALHDHDLFQKLARDKEDQSKNVVSREEFKLFGSFVGVKKGQL